MDAAHQGLFIAQSGIPNSGLGVFAARKFKKDDLIGWYGGGIMSSVKSNSHKNVHKAIKENLWTFVQVYLPFSPLIYGVSRPH